MLSGWETALLTTLVLVLMTGMGATLTLEAFKLVIKHPVGVIIGLCSQFGWMPLIAFGLAMLVGLPNELAISLLVIGSSPGGTTSNMFAYFSRADLALSLSMTAVSTVVAIVMMPLALFLYGSRFTDATIGLPYIEVIKTLGGILFPVAIGMAIRHKSMRVAKIVERIGAFAGVSVLLLLVGNGFINQQGLILETPIELYACAISLGLIGMLMGYGTARAFRLRPAARRAVSLETGIQNSPLAIAVIVLAFPESQHQQMLIIPLLYAIFVLLSASFVTLFWRFVFRTQPSNLPTKD